MRKLSVVSCQSSPLAASLSTGFRFWAFFFCPRGHKRLKSLDSLARRATGDADQLAPRPASGQDGNGVLRQAQMPRKKLDAGLVGLALSGRRVNPQVELAGRSKFQALARGARLHLHPEGYAVPVDVKACFRQSSHCVLGALSS